MQAHPRSSSARAGSLAVALAALAALITACRKPEEPKKPAPAPSFSKFELKEKSSREPPKIAFTDVTAQSGVDFKHVNGAFGKKYLPETMGSGVVIFDYDNDGLPDLFFVQSQEWPGQQKLDPQPTLKLYKNLGGFKFRDVTKEAGLDVSCYGMGACAADVDGDGWVDLFVTTLGPYLLFRNVGGKFTECATQAGLITPTWTDKSGASHPCWSTSAAFLDYDGDGALDLFVCHYVHWSIENDVYDTITGHSKSYTQPTKYEADCCRLYRGDGAFHFTDVTQAAGIARGEGKPNDSKALGVAVDDVNGDGRPDIVVSNDTQPNYLFLSQPGGRYVEDASNCGVAYDENGRARAGMGIDLADPDNDGRFVMSIGNFSGEPVSMYTKNANNLFFVDRSGAARISAPTLLSLTFGVLFCDYDDDGALDLLICNGHIEPEINEVRKEVTYAEPTQLFWNRSDGTFADVSAQVGEVFQRRIVGRGVAAGDLDLDGDLDFVITTNNGAPLLIRNDQATGNHWLRVKLEGNGRNRDALGAVATLEVDGRKLRRVVRTGSSYLSQSDVALLFGLGRTSARELDLVVRWPDGLTEQFTKLAPDRNVKLKEGTGAPVKQ